MGAVFISYRREDSAGYAGRLCDRLNHELGADRVFMDVQDIQPGEQFVNAIEDRMETCDAVVAVIGPRWIQSMRERREEGEDFVRHEIEAALKRGLPVIPALVGGARMPEPRELPDSLGELSRYQALAIGDATFEQDAARLTETVRGLLRSRNASGPVVRSRRAWTAVMVLIAAAAALVFVLARRAPAPVLDGDWIAVMHAENQQPYRIRLELVTSGGALSGRVYYPTGDATIRDGSVRNGRLSFSTTHVAMSADGPAIIRFTGTVADDVIQLVSSSETSVATGAASRAPRER